MPKKGFSLVLYLDYFMLTLFWLFNLLQKFSSIYPQLSSFGSEVQVNDVKETVQQLLRWGWKYNKNLEEQAAQLHMLTGWSQIVEVHCFLKSYWCIKIIGMCWNFVCMCYVCFIFSITFVCSCSLIGLGSPFYSLNLFAHFLFLPPVLLLQISASRRSSMLENRSEVLYQ